MTENKCPYSKVGIEKFVKMYWALTEDAARVAELLFNGTAGVVEFMSTFILVEMKEHRCGNSETCIKQLDYEWLWMSDDEIFELGVRIAMEKRAKADRAKARAAKGYAAKEERKERSELERLKEKYEGKEANA